MRRSISVPALCLKLSALLGLYACGDAGEPPSAGGTQTSTDSEDGGSEDADEAGDGDGDASGDGDGDASGDGDGDASGDGDGEPPSGIVHIGTEGTYDADGQGLALARPPESLPGDLLVLVLHRTDDELPLYVEGWTRVAECYKRDNPNDCSTEEHCTQWHNPEFCQTFGGNDGGAGHDLAQAVFHKTVEDGEPASYTFDLNIDESGQPGWAFLTALRGANTVEPVRDWSNTGCDKDPNSLFPSVTGEAGDMLLLSQSFDDAIAQDNFLPPPGTASLGYVSQSDEAGFLFGGILELGGETGILETGGPGGPNCKDALVSLTIVPS